MNKSKKIINTFENISEIVQIKHDKTNFKKLKKIKETANNKAKEKIKKTKSKKKIRTLWVRRKKKN